MWDLFRAETKIAVRRRIEKDSCVCKGKLFIFRVSQKIFSLSLFSASFSHFREEKHKSFSACKEGTQQRVSFLSLSELLLFSPSKKQQQEHTSHLFLQNHRRRYLSLSWRRIIVWADSFRRRHPEKQPRGTTTTRTTTISKEECAQKFLQCYCHHQLASTKSSSKAKGKSCNEKTRCFITDRKWSIETYRSPW